MQLYYYAIRFLVALIVIPAHEAGHAFAAWRLGDPTARQQGRMSFDPRRHFDLLGTLCLVVAGVGWAKPVPIDARRFKNPKLGMAATALAGPAANLLLAYLSMAAYKVLYYWAPITRANETLALFFTFMVYMNVSLAVFNLLPVPPLDGSRAALLVLPRRLYFRLMRYERYIMLALLALVWLGAADGLLGALNNAVWGLLDSGTAYIDRLAYWLYYRRLAAGV